VKRRVLLAPVVRPAPLALLALFVLLTVASLACRGPRAVAPAEAPAPALSDANIAAIIVAANNADILYADLALAKSQDTDVREFATMVKKDHESVNEAAAALLARLGVTPVDNTASFDLRDDADTKRLILRDLEGFAFDSAYAANELTYHASVLATVDGALIPGAQNAEFKALIVAVRPAVAAHLEHSRTLVAALAAKRPSR
jgi:putative membrane protein